MHFHMDPKAIAKAKSRLRVAERAVAELADCHDFETFNDIWYTFLVSSKNIYTVLEQGSKSSPQSRQWFGAVTGFRKDDELLQYLFEARNDDEHGLENSAEHVPGSLAIGVRREGFSSGVILNGTIGPGGSLHVQSTDGKPVLIKQTLPHVRLISIAARGGRTIDPPKTHLVD